MRIRESPNCPKRNPRARQPLRPDATRRDLAAHLAAPGISAGVRIAGPSQDCVAAIDVEMSFTRSRQTDMGRSTGIRALTARPAFHAAAWHKPLASLRRRKRAAQSVRSEPGLSRRVEANHFCHA
jgi:hypothetical protein